MKGLTFRWKNLNQKLKHNNMAEISSKEGIAYGTLVTMETIVCCQCAIPFGVPSEYRTNLRRSQELFYCPDGHSQSYSKSTDTILREQLAAKVKQEEQLKALVHSAREEASSWHSQWEKQLLDKKAIAAKLKRTENRIANGVCPCCNRTFQDLKKHMTTKHPEKVSDRPKRGRPRKDSK